MYKRLKVLGLIICLATAVFAETDERYPIIPRPISLTKSEGDFVIEKSTSLVYEAGNERVKVIADDFAARLRLVTGFPIACTEQSVQPSSLKIQNSKFILLTLTEGMADEEYSLKVAPAQVTVTATTPAGLFYGLQTFCQLLPPQIFGNVKASRVKWKAACCTIRDKPRFPYRGLMLDCGRYFYPKEFVMKMIDIMAMHKQNMFHWHLTEDQGWRIEIKKYPRLTEVGSMREETKGRSKTGDGKPHGGFYTQDDVREVVEYARRRCVTVIPEIEMPGHSEAAIAAYPELSCFPDSAYRVATSWGVKKNVYCPTATTFRFLEDVFTELFELFPSPYYHIGGDECPRDRWKQSAYCQDLMKILGITDEDQLQIFFMQRMSKFIKEKANKTLIGWDEILDGGAVPGAVVMSYRGHAPAMRASREGIYTVLAANRWNYLDNSQDDPEASISINEFMPLEKTYKYFPIPDTMPAARHHFVIGQEGCLWGEHIPDVATAEHYAYPRAIAMAEVAWCPKERKDWDSFRRRMLIEFKRLDLLGVNYSRAFDDVILTYDKNSAFPRKLRLTVDHPEALIRYTTDGSEPAESSPLYSEELKVEAGETIRAQAFLDGKKLGKEKIKSFGKSVE